ncbi:Transthyretin-like family protein [Ancylostoma ceylanicum]|uniref:Transthyretin-like family protein n=1 Tax=Ancylostoma ceylanicum TaxID=53326 RepID=A0A0D6LBV0_9BILA|nr:Transthyretin-like family protein [Ancylostoma ceylanicum]
MEVVIFLFLISSCYGSLLDIFGREQSVGVEGTLLCNGKAAAGVDLLLYDIENPYCAKKKRIPIPSKYIVQGTSVKKYYNIGRLDLSSNKWDDGFKRCHLYSGIIN